MENFLDSMRTGAIDVGLDGRPVRVDLNIDSDYLIDGVRILKDIFKKSDKLIIHDIHFRTDRFVYYDTAAGLRIDEEYGRLSSSAVCGILLALVYNRNTAICVSEVLQQHERISLENALTENRCSDFSCMGDKPEYLDDSPLSIGNNRLRIQCHFSSTGIGITVRILRDRIMTLEETGLPGDVITQLTSMMQKKSGLGLVTGATGSGKSTTLAALIEWIRKNCQKHIVTIEDPIEFHYGDTITAKSGNNVASQSLVTQQEVGRDVVSFAQGIKAALRKKPDIILLGEIRDSETMTACMEAAQTGHLILSTLHTRGAAKTLSRILEFYRDAGEQKGAMKRLSEVLMFILSQGLIPREDKVGKILCVEFFASGDIATKSAIDRYFENPTTLSEIMIKGGNVQWDSYLRHLRGQHIVSEESEHEYSLEFKKEK